MKKQTKILIGIFLVVMVLLCSFLFLKRQKPPGTNNYNVVIIVGYVE